MSNKVSKQGNTRGTSEVRRRTSSIHFHCPVPRSSSHIGHRIGDKNWTRTFFSNFSGTPGYAGQDPEGGQKPGKTSIWARTSMTRRRGRPRPLRDFHKLRSEKLWAEFSFPSCAPYTGSPLNLQGEKVGAPQNSLQKQARSHLFP